MTLPPADPPPAALPPLLKDNPRLEQWVWFETPGRVTVSTGRVEIGQGVLTAMVPELFVELINPLTDLPPLGLGEATGGPTVAAIGNAVAQALGVRIHDLPMTRERVMAALLNKE